MRLPALLVISTLLALGSGAGFADDKQEHEQHDRGRHPHPRQNDEAARRAQQQNGGGRILSVEPAEGGHRVKVLKNGEVRVLVVPEEEKR